MVSETDETRELVNEAFNLAVDLHHVVLGIDIDEQYQATLANIAGVVEEIITSLEALIQEDELT